MNRKGIGGRKPIEVIYKDVLYNSKPYLVGKIQSKNGTFQFVVDGDDKDTVRQYNWHITSTGYVSTSIYEDEKQKSLLLHRLIMNVPYFPGKGAKESVDHINRNPLDNRKENLRVVSQTEQNLNQKKKRRIVELPDGCGITPNDIPKHVWYVRANGLHGDRFAIEFKTEGIVWKSTSSKKVSLHEKLDQVKEKLSELYDQYPHLNPITNDVINKSDELNTEFQDIITLASSHTPTENLTT